MHFILLMGTLLTQLHAAPMIAREGVWIQDPNKQHLTAIHHQGELIIDHVSREGYEVYGPSGMTQWLQMQGINYLSLEVIKSVTTSDYPSYDEVVQKLRSLQGRYSRIMKLFSLGKSVQGRDLWVMKISDNPAQDEVEPEFKYIANMHGDEITGRELMLKLIEDIGENYSRNHLIAELVDNTEIFIMPSMNPDGSMLHRRANANYVDLNRNFPDFSTDDNQNTWADRALETQNIMQFQRDRNFSLSANFHGGAEVVNYAWDTIADVHPFDQMLREISLGYASRVSYMHTSAEFTQGITNGYAWYEVNGGMQDWSYYWHNDLQFTIELSQQKWPDFNRMGYYYQENRNALVDFISKIHQGAGFKFENNNLTGDVEVFELAGSSGAHSLGRYHFIRGEFYKVLEAGRYRFVMHTANGIAQEFITEVRSGNIQSNGNYKNL